MCSSAPVRSTTTTYISAAAEQPTAAKGHQGDNISARWKTSQARHNLA